MKANSRFFGIMFVFNMIFGLIGFLVMWGIRALTSNNIIGIILSSCAFVGLAIYINLFVVKKSKLKIPYFMYGTVINVIFIAVPTALTMIL